MKSNGTLRSSPSGRCLRNRGDPVAEGGATSRPPVPGGGHCQEHHGLAVEPGLAVGLPAPTLDPGDVLQADGLTGGRRLQDDVGELLRRGQPAQRRDGERPVSPPRLLSAEHRDVLVLEGPHHVGVRRRSYAASRSGSSRTRIP